MTFAGIFLAGVSVAIFKASDFGTDPNSCFVMGVWNLAGIKYSYVYIAINALMLLGVFFLDRHFIGLGTVLNLFFMGIIVEKGMHRCCNDVFCVSAVFYRRYGCFRL